MGYILKCDLCGEAFETTFPQNNLLQVRIGENDLFVGYVCEDCVEKLLDYLSHKQNKTEKKRK